jgi:predicted nucleic acid-binding Zn finger protein
MILSMFVKGKVNFKHVEIWLWVFFSKQNLTLSKYDFEYVCQKKSWLWTCQYMILSMFVKWKVDFKHVQIWLWIYLSKEKLTPDMSKYDFEYNYEIKLWLSTCPNMILSMFVKGKVDFRYVQIWL